MDRDSIETYVGNFTIADRLHSPALIYSIKINANVERGKDVDEILLEKMNKIMKENHNISMISFHRVDYVCPNCGTHNVAEDKFHEGSNINNSCIACLNSF